MSIRNIRTIEDCASAFKEIDDYLNYLKTDSLDLNRRRIKNASPSEEDYDYVVRKELKDLQGGPTTIKPRAGSISQGGYYLRTFGFGIATAMTTGVDLLPPLIIPFTSTTLVKIYAKAKIAPTGQSAIADINLAGVSILGTSKIVIAAGSTSPITPLSTFDTSNFYENQVLTFDVDQVGSIAAGQVLVVTMKFRVNQV